MQHQSGNIQLILGPMFSGKSSELIKLIHRYNIKKRKTIVIKYNLDDRYENSLTNVVTHDQFTYPALKCSKLSEIKETLLKHEVIGIDEGQFFPDLAEVCEELANCGKHIVISALKATFKREAFPTIAALFPKCESIINLQSICYFCNDDAPFTLRTVSDEDDIQNIEVGNKNLIGGLDMYKPACRNCHIQHTNKDIKDNSSTSEEDKTEIKEDIEEINEGISA